MQVGLPPEPSGGAVQDIGGKIPFCLDEATREIKTGVELSSSLYLIVLTLYFLARESHFLF